MNNTEQLQQAVSTLTAQYIKHQAILHFIKHRELQQPGKIINVRRPAMFVSEGPVVDAQAHIEMYDVVMWDDVKDIVEDVQGRDANVAAEINRKVQAVTNYVSTQVAIRLNKYLDGAYIEVDPTSRIGQTVASSGPDGGRYLVQLDTQIQVSSKMTLADLMAIDLTSPYPFVVLEPEIELMTRKLCQLSISRNNKQFVFGQLEIPRGVEFGGKSEQSNDGISVRLVRAYDVRVDQFITRFDVLVGLTNNS